MKKNLISVIILALCLVNFVLNALLIFTILPETKKANTLIDKVCSAISLDLNSGSATGSSNVPIDEQEIYTVNAGETLTTNLAGDGSHYVVFGVTLSLNTNSDNYTTYSPDVLTAQDSKIVSEIINIMSSYTYDDASAAGGQEKIQEEILVKMQDMFGSDYVIGVNFSTWTLS